jgi:hypothetical protein
MHTLGNRKKCFCGRTDEKNHIGICYRPQAIINSYCSSREPEHLLLGAWGSPSMRTCHVAALWCRLSRFSSQCRARGIGPGACAGRGSGQCEPCRVVASQCRPLRCRPLQCCASDRALAPAAGALHQCELCCRVMCCSFIAAGLGWCPGPLLQLCHGVLAVTRGMAGKIQSEKTSKRML